MFTNILTAKALSVAAVAVLATGTTTAAAAGGTLPEPAQRFVATTASYVGLSLPLAPEDETQGVVPVPVTLSQADATTTTLVGTTTSVLRVEEATTTTVVEVVKPGPQTCATARLEEGARGCSGVAHEGAPGQLKKDLIPRPPTTETTSPKTLGPPVSKVPKEAVQAEKPKEAKEAAEDHPGQGNKGTEKEKNVKG